MNPMLPSSSFITPRVIIVSLLAFSLFMSFSFLLFLKDIGPSEHSEPGSDYFTRYTPMAKSILEGKGIPLEKDIGAPGYSLLLVPVFLLSRSLDVPETALTTAFNIMLVALTVLVLFYLTKEAFSQRVAYIASLLWASYPLNLWFIKNPHTEVPFFLFFLCSLLLYVKGVYQRSSFFLFAGGFFLGFATLIRPVTFYLPIVLLIMMFFLLRKKLKNEWRETLRFAAVFLCGTILAVFPWIWYVYGVTGEFVPISTIGRDAVLTGLTYAFIGDGSHQTKVPEDVRQFMERARNVNLLTQKDIARFTIKEFRMDPIPLIKLFGLKIARAWYATSSIWWETQLLLLQTPYLLSAVIGIVLAFKRLRSRDLLILFLAMIGYFWLLSVATVSIIRYTMPAMLFLMPFSAFALYALTKEHRYLLSFIAPDK